MVLAPLVVIYAFVAYRGQYESRSIRVLILLAVTVSVAALLSVSVAPERYSCFSSEAMYLVILRNVIRLISLIALFFVLRGYIHSEINLIKSKKWKPRSLLQKIWFKRR
ncbi:MAG: hypothetical protein V1817_01740 [Candidatus Micrarchaeota archaeon]